MNLLDSTAGQSHTLRFLLDLADDFNEKLILILFKDWDEIARK